MIYTNLDMQRIFQDMNMLATRLHPPQSVQTWAWVKSGTAGQQMLGANFACFDVPSLGFSVKHPWKLSLKLELRLCQSANIYT